MSIPLKTKWFTLRIRNSKDRKNLFVKVGKLFSSILNCFFNFVQMRFYIRTFLHAANIIGWCKLMHHLFPVYFYSILFTLMRLFDFWFYIKLTRNWCMLNSMRYCVVPFARTFFIHKFSCWKKKGSHFTFTERSNKHIYVRASFFSRALVAWLWASFIFDIVKFVLQLSIYWIEFVYVYDLKYLRK